MREHQALLQRKTGKFDEWMQCLEGRAPQDVLWFCKLVFLIFRDMFCTVIDRGFVTEQVELVALGSNR